MPSPIGHALAGVAAGWMVVPPRGDRRRVAALALFCAVAAVAPDVDLAFSAHSGPTHGLGAAAVAGLIVYGVWTALARTTVTPARAAVAAAAAYASHTLLDWLGSDSSPPIGIMALWPVSGAYYESPLHVFRAISRRYWLPEFWTANVIAIGQELAILLPLVVLVYLLRRRR